MHFFIVWYSASSGVIRPEAPAVCKVNSLISICVCVCLCKHVCLCVCVCVYYCVAMCSCMLSNLRRRLLRRKRDSLFRVDCCWCIQRFYSEAQTPQSTKNCRPVTQHILNLI